MLFLAKLIFFVELSSFFYNPDFSYYVDDDDQLLRVYAIVGDSGILTVNKGFGFLGDHECVAFHNFLENN
jgi:hypothetical protein